MNFCMWMDCNSRFDAATCLVVVLLSCVVDCGCDVKRTYCVLCNMGLELMIVTDLWPLLELLCL